MIATISKVKSREWIGLCAGRGRRAHHVDAGITREGGVTTALWEGSWGRLGEVTPSAERNGK